MSQPPMAMMESPRSRLSAIQSNVRNLLRNPVPSSVYSRSAHASAAPTPRIPPVPSLPPLAFFRRQEAMPDEESRPVLRDADTHNRRDSLASHSPPTSMRSAGGSPISQISMWREQAEPATPGGGTLTSHHGDGSHIDEEAFEDVEGQGADSFLGNEDHNAAHRHRHRKRRRNCKHCRKGRGAWFKHRHHRQNVWKGRTKVKAVGAVMSGIMLVVLLASYLSLALTQSGIGVEIHVLFITSILADTIFFAHCVIRLCMLVRKSHRPRRHHRNRFLHMSDTEGFQPIAPVRVHVAADEEPLDDGCQLDGDLEAPVVETDTSSKKVKVPPPAYGLWRSSVRINPNLLHWARVNQPPTPNNPFGTPVITPSSHSSPQMQQREPERHIPRPPSYVSDDGVTYIVQAQPRSTLLMPSLRPPSALHPAMRTGARDMDARSDDGVGTIAIGLGFDEHGR